MLLLTATLIATGLTFSAIRFADKLSGWKRVDEIIIHCTATPRDTVVTIDDIEQWHLKRGFTGIGYHYVIGLNGEKWNGRDVDLIGAHVNGYNAHSIGISYVGGLENKPGVPYNKLKAKDTRTEAQKASLLSLLVELRKLYPKAKISGHRDFSPDKNHNGIVEPQEWIKCCPSFDAKKEYSRI